MASKKAGGNSSKIGRYKLKCAAYSSSQRRLKNKKRKLAKHIKHQPNDRQAFHAHQNIFIVARDLKATA